MRTAGIAGALVLVGLMVAASATGPAGITARAQDGRGDVVWLDDLKAGIEQATKDGRPVLVVFR